jgi:phosphohistidine phosphatase SixA
MAVYLVRHAHAGSRQPDNHDRYRQLSDKGWRRANVITDILDDLEIDNVLSSPATRCVQTVQGVADRHDLEVIEHEDLWEDADTDAVMDVLESAVGGGTSRTVVVCSHGNLIPVIVEQLALAGAKVKGRGCEKGSIWVLDHDGKRFTACTYISKTVEMLFD